MFSNGSYARVWKLGNKREKSLSAQISTSYKKKDSDEYVTDFSSYVLFVGKAAEKELKERTTIRLTDVGVRSTYNKEKGVQETTFIVRDFEPVDPVKKDDAVPAAAPAPAQEDDADDDIDF